MYPLFGWHKTSYINVVGVLGVVAFFALAAMPISTAGVAGLFLLMGNLQVVFFHSRNKTVCFVSVFTNFFGRLLPQICSWRVSTLARWAPNRRLDP
jgi:hypothetical protein